MLFYRAVEGVIVAEEWAEGDAIPADAVWIDLLSPSKQAEQRVEEFLGMDIPTREEMGEIEVSNRLYQENGAQFMTATLLSKVDTGAPETHAVTFIIAENRLVTIRYVDTTSFRRFGLQLVKSPCGCDGPAILLGLLDAIVNRIADVLERLDRDLDRVTKDIFRRTDAGRVTGVDYQFVLERIGRCGDLASKLHESLVTLGRVAGFAAHSKQMAQQANDTELSSLRRDIAGLTDHGTFLNGRVQFLLDATLGMISIQQNNVFRVLALASLIFMPPTLVAGIYGMNFKILPELEWHFGYPLALLAMLVSAILPYWWLKRRKYL